MNKKIENTLSLIGILFAIFLIVIREYVTVDFQTFAYSIALTRIPSFFSLVVLALTLVLMGTQIVSERLYAMGLFLLSSLPPYLFHILSFVFFPNFITPNTRDKAAWLYLVSSVFVLLAISIGVFNHKLTSLKKHLRIYATSSFLISVLVSFLIVLYYPYLPKTYQPGFGSTPIRDAFDVILLLWASYVTYYTIKRKPFGYNANSTISLALLFFSLSSLLTIFYVTFTDLLIVASTVYRFISYLLLAYAILVLEVRNSGENVTRSSKMLIASLPKAEPKVENGVQKFFLGEVLEKGNLKNLYIYDAKDGRMLACFYSSKEESKELYKLTDYSYILAKRVGYIGENTHFQVLGDHIIVSTGQFHRENPILNLNLLNLEMLMHGYFAQRTYFNQLIQEKSKELERLNLILETSEYATQAYNNIETFSRQVLDRLDYVIPMDGSVFYMYNKKSEDIEKFVVSSNAIRNFQEHEIKTLLYKTIDVSDTKRIENNVMFVKFEQENYQAGIIGLRSMQNFQKEDFLFLETVSNQLFHVVKLMKVIEDLEKAQLSVRFLSEYDPLTLLYNRRSFEESLRENIERGQRTMESLSIIFMDIDDFKLINDTYGYSTGDLALKFIAEVLKNNLRRIDVPGRLGEDEFAILLPSINKHTAKSVAERIIGSIKENSLEVDGRTIVLSVSTVIISYPHDGYSVEELISTGELLMRDLKRKGKGLLFVSEEDTKYKVETVRGFEKAILEGLNEDAIIPYFQEITDVKSGKLLGFEVLMRITFGGRILTAGEFIPIAERLNLMPKFDLMLVEKVFKEYQKFGGKHIFLFLNMVPENASEEFAELVKAKADEFLVPTDRIVFEITERNAIQDILSVSKFIRELKSLGFKFAIDDFGSGYSSFYYLKYLPVDYLKIEGDFIRSLPYSATDRTFIKAMVNVAKEMGIKTVAEFVEDERIFQLVKELGIDYAQGHFLGKPEDLENKLRSLSSKEEHP